MDNLKTSTAIVILCLLFINFSSTIGDEGQQSLNNHEKAESDTKQSFSGMVRSLFSISTSSPISTSYWGKLKNHVNQAYAYFFPPNLDFRRSDQADGTGAGEAASIYGSGPGEKVKEAVSKSLETSKETVEDAAKSAARIAGETVHKTKEKMKKSMSAGKKSEQAQSEL
ncbi:uncharacterized protein LOC125418654 [Ziziphus jujuba]|uniref:Uncharacterized protein LOC125418654 n=2 Tax=Ziziphus jujuba TaxID=326968 RepID=A0A6P4AC52_ZIZJJ|nr:uncharacterized protein LOC125418654 [Ziziphus jujuba]KAH7515311.1 hypothetical protein FEM48_Zijuj10G0013200 [Ziziphus jujuba var. spinosa]